MEYCEIEAEWVLACAEAAYRIEQLQNLLDEQP